MMTQENSNFAIKVSDLKKTYYSNNSEVTALNSINLNIPYGSFFGLLGPNGAGKSTFINILAGITKKTSGTASICGYDIIKECRNAKSSIGIVPQELQIDPFFPPYESLEYMAGYYGIKKSERKTKEILKALGLADKSFTSARKLSGGMKRRLLVAKALVHSPKVLILDEPTAGVDINLRKQIWDYIKKLNKEGTTIILTTHYLEEAEKLCDQITVLDKGSIIAQDSKKNLINFFNRKKIIVHTNNTDNLKENINSKQLKDLDITINKNSLEIIYSKDKTSINSILSAISQINVDILDLSTEENSLEKVFMDLTKEKKAK